VSGASFHFSKKIMQIVNKILTVSILIISATYGKAQHTGITGIPFANRDSILYTNNWKIPAKQNHLSLKSMILPTAMITYGLLSLNSDGLKNVDDDFQRKIWIENPHKQLHLDNYLFLAPGVTAFTLYAFGVHGKNNLRDKAMIYLMSSIFTNGIVFSTKKITNRLRPDKSHYNSFPSGHSALAFSSAEFLRMEYKNVSAWYGIAGYTTAVATAYLRMYNNKHWFSDVVAGAGVGIASTKLAYWLYPKIQHWFFKDKPAKTTFLPNYSNGAWGVGLIHNF